MKNKLKELQSVCSVVLAEAISEHLKTSSIKTFDFANASTETTDFYINKEKKNCKKSA